MDDGGPAFPKFGTYNQGMSLRDYFAAAALQGMLASAPLTDRTKVNKKKWASVAHQFADAMIAKRKKRKK